MAIKGVFEPFNKYVTDQLKLRRQMISNPQLQLNIFSNEETGDPEIERFYRGQTSGRDDNFYTWATQRQCVIKMVSGVDIIPANSDLGITNILEDSIFENNLGGFSTDHNGNQYTFKALENQGMARAYVLGSYLGNDSYFYGNPAWRSNPQDGFGIVPPPGITDATIDTKSDDGSLREATVNFVCHNRRQLEVLEALYMRPGYPIMLEWGWNPYIVGNFSENVLNANGQIYSDYNSEKIINEFLNPDSNINTINYLIQAQKRGSGGNYDGFVGYCKNFLFKVREDGGYNCTTELIAHGEILESLKQKITMVHVTPSIEDLQKSTGRGKRAKEYRRQLMAEREPIDDFLLYLRSIKFSLDKAGDATWINLVGTESEEIVEENNLGDAALYTASAISMAQYNTSFLGALFTSWFWDKAFEEDEVYYVFKDAEGKEINMMELNNTPGGNKGKYHLGWKDLAALVMDVAKVSEEDITDSTRGWKHIPTPIAGNDLSFGDILELDPDSPAYDVAISDRKHHLGLDSMFEGTILKEQVLDDPELLDEEKQTSGVSKNIFVRWDLICNIINKRITPEYKKDHAIVELTYLHPGESIYSPGAPEDGKIKYPSTEVNPSYIRYQPNPKESFIPSDKTKSESDPAARLIMRIKQLDSNDTMLVYVDKFEEGELVQVDPNDTNVKEITEEEAKAKSVETETTTMEKISVANLLGRSYDNSVCLMPHQVVEMNAENVQDSYGPEMTFNLDGNFTSYKNVGSANTSIGLVYFNLDYLIKTYEDLVLEEYKTDLNGKIKWKTRMKDKFNFHDWITTIWNGVNDACAGYYDFGLHVENERPNVARIIDFTFAGDLKNTEKEIFTFNPQGLNSITRESNFQSKLDNDFASVISIAAQSPNDVHSLEAVAFKAFHKGIRNRFTSKNEGKDGRDDLIEEAEAKYVNDYKEYEDMVESLKFFITKMNASNYETELTFKDVKDSFRKPMDPETAKSYASQLEEKRISLATRHPEFNEDGIKNDGKDGRPYCGQYRDESTHYRNAIIPLTTSMTLDGIGGINPLNVFQINKDKLPLGYQNPNIAFVVKKETHKITAGQDWTTDITGYLTLLNNNPMKGENKIDEEVERNVNNEITQIDNETSDWINPFEHDVVTTSTWPERAQKDWATYGRYHAGLDLRCAAGQFLLAPRDGVIEAPKAGSYNSTTHTVSGYGKFLIINFNEPDTNITHPLSGKSAAKSAYAHMNRVDVSVGDSVIQGQIVGTCGTTPSVDPHLHYELGTEDFNTSAYWGVKGSDHESGDTKKARIDYALLDPNLVLNT